MKSITSTWFECKVRYNQMQEDGLLKRVTEQYVVDALSFSEAEKRITEEVGHYVGEFEVAYVKKTSYREVLFMSEVEKKFHNEVDEMCRALQKGDEKGAQEVFDRTVKQQTNTESHWFKAKLAFISLDEKTAKEKHTCISYLVQATSFDNAVNNINIAMQGTMIDFEKSNLAETKIIDVFRDTERESYDEQA